MTDKYGEMLEAARPLIKWLNDNYHPHCEVVVTCSTVELKEGVAKRRCYDYIGDGVVQQCGGNHAGPPCGDPCCWCYDRNGK